MALVSGLRVESTSVMKRWHPHPFTFSGVRHTVSREMRVSRARKLCPTAWPSAVAREPFHREVSIPTVTGEQSAAALPPRPGGSARDARRLAAPKVATRTGLAFDSAL